MLSLKELYKIGNGPSSSHTIGPKLATLKILQTYNDFDYVRVTLYGSLALTGKGHLTDYIISKTLGSIKHEIVFNYLDMMEHPNTILFELFKDGKLVVSKKVYSIGGGSILFEGEEIKKEENLYPHNYIYQIIEYCNQNNMDYKDYVYKFEPTIKPYLQKIYQVMMNTIENGLNKEGILHGELKINRKAKRLISGLNEQESDIMMQKRKLTAYAYAVSEENASGGEIVTAPTCGASGVLPACVKMIEELKLATHDEILDGLAVAGLFGNIVKTNASISGAEAGCQAEIGTACSMSAAFIATIYKLPLKSVEQAAEIALEHHLGLTCDPVKGYVQIPCIERNAVAALRAFDAADLAKMLDSKDSKISFDLVCKTMLETGKDLGASYRETSIGGLARNYNR